MNRKELACGAVGVMLSTVGCASATRTSALPVGGLDQSAAAERSISPAEASPHVSEVLLSLISGTPQDISSAIFRLRPKSGWSIVSDNPKLYVEMRNGHVALLEAPQDEKVQLVATATISHPDGTHFLVRCHIQPGC